MQRIFPIAQRAFSNASRKRDFHTSAPRYNAYSSGGGSGLEFALGFGLPLVSMGGTILLLTFYRHSKETYEVIRTLDRRLDGMEHKIVGRIDTLEWKAETKNWKIDGDLAYIKGLLKAR